MARWNLCNVYDPGPGTRNVWSFNAASKKFTLQREESRAEDQPLPKNLIAKDWHSLFQPKLNIAWLPPNGVFLRAIQLPKGSNTELQSMIDIQLEKLSPRPPAQIVWTFQPLTQFIDELQTVIVIMVARSLVEGFLGKLEADGYLADRLEVPLLDQLAATSMDEDGVWIYPNSGSNPHACLAAWFYGGILHNLTLIPVPPETDMTQVIQEHLTQVAWAGEIEGWLNSPIRIHLVAQPEVAATWENIFTEEQRLVVVPPIPLTDLATRTGKRVLRDPARLNLLPPEYLSRYKQTLLDKLWMRTLAAIGVLYILLALFYVGWAQLVRYQKTRIDNEIAAVSSQYTETQKLKAEVAILEDQLALQYAALDSWKAITDNIPSELQLDKIDFSRGKITITGTGSENISDFETRLRNAANLQDQRVFAEVNLKSQITLPNGRTTWTINTVTTRGATK